MSARLCVATYGEDVSWVAQTGLEACVYDATGQREGLIPVPNIAREASQYLHHIVTHYGNFREYEIFLQGDPKPHNPAILHWLSIAPWKGKDAYHLGRSIIKFDPNLQIPHMDHVLPFMRQIGMKDREVKPWNVGAMFAASRGAIESRPLEWWQMLLEKVTAERAWSPWVMEQLWFAILTAPHHHR